MTTREKIKQEIDQLSDRQVEAVAAFIAMQTHAAPSSAPLWQTATPSERSAYFRAWVAQLPKHSPSLPLEAISRNSIYDQ
jgi:acyl-CoA reductase-like NAD-dependent aldehyde dehydrogenase